MGSKWGYAYTGGWRVDAETHEVKDLSAGQLRTQLAETRALLGDRLRLYQIHSATVDSGVLEDPDVRAHLAELRDEGVAIGFTAPGADQAATIDRALATSANKIGEARGHLVSLVADVESALASIAREIAA